MVAIRWLKINRNSAQQTEHWKWVQKKKTVPKVLILVTLCEGVEPVGQPDTETWRPPPGVDYFAKPKYNQTNYKASIFQTGWYRAVGWLGLIWIKNEQQLYVITFGN